MKTNVKLTKVDVQFVNHGCNNRALFWILGEISALYFANRVRVSEGLFRGVWMRTWDFTALGSVPNALYQMMGGDPYTDVPSHLSN